MPQPTLALKSTVTRRDAPTPVDEAERTRQAEHHQAAVTRDSVPVPRDKPPQEEKHDLHELQVDFLNAHLDRPVTVYLITGIKLVGTLRQFDQFTLLLQGPDGIESMVYKQAVSTVQPGTARSRTPHVIDYEISD